MLSYKAAAARAEKENVQQQGIEQISRRTQIDAYFHENVPCDSNVLIDGGGDIRNSVLLYWLIHLYEEMDNRPVIFLSRDEELPNRLIALLSDFREQDEDGFLPDRKIYLVDRENRIYDPFLGMPSNAIQNVLQKYAEKKGMNIDGWTVFMGVFSVLNRYGYAISLFNLLRLYCLQKDIFTDFLRRAGEMAAFRECSRTGSREKEQVFEVLRNMKENFSAIYGGFEGTSILEQIFSMDVFAKDGYTEMPFFCFTLPEIMRNDFLSYLQVELRAIEAVPPVLVIDSISLQQEEHSSEFFQYLKTAQNLSLTLSAPSCLSMLPAAQTDNFEILDGKYQFHMIFLKSANTVEKLTKGRVGTYDYKKIIKNMGQHRQAFHFFSDGDNEGWHEEIETKVRLGHDDVVSLLEERECYILPEHDLILKYKNMVFC